MRPQALPHATPRRVATSPATASIASAVEGVARRIVAATKSVPDASNPRRAEATERSAAPADRRTWIRRVFLEVVGLAGSEGVAQIGRHAKDRRLETSPAARMAHRAFDEQIEEKRIVAVDLVEPLRLVFGDVAVAGEPRRACHDVDAGQRVVASVHDARVQVVAFEQRVEGPADMVIERRRRELREQQAAPTRFVEKPQQEVEARHLRSSGIVEVDVDAVGRRVQRDDAHAHRQRLAEA